MEAFVKRRVDSWHRRAVDRRSDLIASYAEPDELTSCDSYGIAVLLVVGHLSSLRSSDGCSRQSCAL